MAINRDRTCQPGDWSLEEVDPTAHLLIAHPQGGVVVIGRQEIAWLRPATPAVKMAMPGGVVGEIKHYALIDLSTGQRCLLSDEAGKLHLLIITANGMRLEPLGQLPALPSSLCYAGSGRVFIASSHGPQVMIQLNKHRDSQTNNFFSLLSQSDTLAPLLDATQLDQSSPELSLVACANAHAQGGLVFCRQGLRLEVEAEAELPLMCLKGAYATQEGLIVTGPQLSWLISRDWEVKPLGHCVIWADEQWMVTTDCLMRNGQALYSFASTATIAGGHGDFLAVALSNGSVQVFRDGILMGEYAGLPVAPAALCVNEKGQCLIGGWLLPDGSGSAVSDLNGQVIFKSDQVIRCLAWWNGQLCLGLGNGEIVIMNEAAMTENKRVVKAGREPVSQLLVQGEACFVLCGSLSQLQADGRLAPWIEHGPVEAMAVLEGQLVLLGGGLLRVAQLPTGPAGAGLHLFRSPLGQTVRRVCRLPGLLACLGNDQLFLLRDASLLDRYGFGEGAELASLLTLEHRGMQLIVVGMQEGGHGQNDEEESAKAYLVTFAAEDGRLRMMGRTETPGLVYCLQLGPGEGGLLIGSMEGSLGMWQLQGETAGCSWRLLDRYHVGVLGVQMEREGSSVLLGDMLRSCSLLEWKEQKWHGVAHSYHSDWITAVAMGKCWLAADSLGNLQALQASTEGRITCLGALHLGQTVNRLLRLGPRGLFTDAWLYFTTLGTIGLIGFCADEKLKILRHLETKLAMAFPWVGQFDQAAWRLPHAALGDSRSWPTGYFVDGLQVERWPTLSAEEQGRIWSVEEVERTGFTGADLTRLIGEISLSK